MSVGELAELGIKIRSYLYKPALAVAAVLGTGFVWYLWPVLTQWIYFPQDRCSFGTVTNAQYRDYLLEAKRLRAARWPPLKFEFRRGPGQVSGHKLSRRLLIRLQNFTADSRTPDELVARIHAVMRAHGARHHAKINISSQLRNIPNAKKDFHYVYYGPSLYYDVYYPWSSHVTFYIGVDSTKNNIPISKVRENNHFDNIPNIPGEGMFSCPKLYGN